MATKNSPPTAAKEQSEIAHGLKQTLRVAASADAPALKRRTAADFELLLEEIIEEADAGREVDMPALMAAVRGKK